MKKRILALVLSVMMTASSFPVYAAELEDFSVIGEVTEKEGAPDAEKEDSSGEPSESSEGAKDLEPGEDSGENTKEKEDASAAGTGEDTEETTEESTEENTEEIAEESQLDSGEMTDGLENEDAVEEEALSEKMEKSASSKESADEYFTDEWLKEHGLTRNEEGLFEYEAEDGEVYIYDPEDPDFWKYFMEDSGEKVGLNESFDEDMELFSSEETYSDPFTCALTGDKYSYPKYYKTDSAEDRVMVRYGVDVSKYQGTISRDNWSKMKEKYGIDFAIIRAGFRGWGSAGNMKADETFTANLKNAHNAGVNTGVYFFSQAINEDEAREEADYCLELIGGNIDLVNLPIMIDYEYAGGADGRLTKADLSEEKHTDIVNAFCRKIREKGHDAGVYANKSMFLSDMDFSSIPKSNYIWMAHWPSAKSGVHTTDFSKRLNCWQFTDAFTGFGTSGTGYMINDKVDLDFWFDIYPGETTEGKLVFESNGAEGSQEKIVADIGQKVKLPECTFTKEGGTFKEWNTKADGKGTSYAPGDEYTIKGRNEKLYAIWDYTPYKLTFMPEGGEVDVKEMTVYFNGKAIGELPIPVREDYHFVGWYTKEGVVVSSTYVLSAASDLTVYAHWEKIVPTSISLSYNCLNLERGKSAALSAVTAPEGIKAEIIWSSDDDSIASIKDGIITAKEIGKTRITAQIKDTDLSAYCDVTVYSTDIENDEEEVKESFEAPAGIWLLGFTGSYTYTGSKITPSFKVYFGKTLLRSGTDYTVSYLNNVNAGTATAVVQGKGSFSGKASKTFTILPQELSDKDIDIAVSKENKGKTIKPAVTVTHDGKTLKENKDYRLEFDPVTEAKTASVTVTGTGNYKNSFTKEFTVKEAAAPDIKSVTVAGLKKSYTLDELKDIKMILDGISISYKKETVDPEEYSLKLENISSVGKGTLVISPTKEGRFAGIKKVSFNITGTKLGSMVLSQTEFIYDGTSKRPEITVYTGKKGQGDLIGSDFYSVSYSSMPVNAGTVTVTVTGNASKGYTGKLSAKYKIQALDVATARTEGKLSVTCPSSVIYAQGGAAPEPLLVFTDADGKRWTLREGADYTVKYQNNKSAASAKPAILTITGKGNFTGKSSDISFAIAKRSISSLPVSCADIAANASKKGSYYYSKPVITDVNGKLLKEKTDYVVSYEKLSGESIGKNDVLRSGTSVRATIIATNKNYTGQVSVIYKVTSSPKDIAKAVVGKIADRPYTGRAVEIDDLSLTFEGKELVEGSDYMITGYYNNIKKGTATLRVQGTGSYCGARLITFKIVSTGIGAEGIWNGAYEDGALIKD
jgi:uncharacterized repeat protein (TIGR02543 family)